MCFCAISQNVLVIIFCLAPWTFFRANDWRVESQTFCTLFACNIPLPCLVHINTLPNLFSSLHSPPWLRNFCYFSVESALHLVCIIPNFFPTIPNCKRVWYCPTCTLYFKKVLLAFQWISTAKRLAKASAFSVHTFQPTIILKPGFSVSYGLYFSYSQHHYSWSVVLCSQWLSLLP